MDRYLIRGVVEQGKNLRRGAKIVPEKDTLLRDKPRMENTSQSPPITVPV